MNKLAKYASGRNVLLLFIITIVVYVWIVFVSIPTVLAKAPEMVIFDMSPLGYSAGYAGELLDAIEEVGRASYLYQQLPMDFVYPGLFAITYSLMLIWVVRKYAKENSKLFMTAYIPMAAGAFDYLENIGIISILVTYPEISPSIVLTSSIFTISKSLMTVIFYTILIYSFCAWGYKIWAQPVAGGDRPRCRS